LVVREHSLVKEVLGVASEFKVQSLRFRLLSIEELYVRENVNNVYSAEFEFELLYLNSMHVDNVSDEKVEELL